MGESLLDNGTESRVGEDRVALLQVEPRSVQPPLAVDVLALQVGPDPRHPLDAFTGGVGGESDAVDGTHGRAVDPIGNEPVLCQHLEHPDLDRSPGASACEDQSGHLLLVLLLVLVFVRYVFIT